MNTLSASGRWQPGEVLLSAGGRRIQIRHWRGEGSYARVYQGVDLDSGKFHAVKVAKAELPESIHRLMHEQAILGQVNHARLVTLLDGGRHAGSPFLLLEWLDGETLADFLRKKRRLPLRQSLEFLEAIAEGLSVLNAADLPHGDVRLQNVMVTARGPVLMDPGAEEHGTAGADVRAAGELFHWMLLGCAPDTLRPRLVSGAGLHPKAVALWDRTQAPLPPTPAGLLEEVRRLRTSL